MPEIDTGELDYPPFAIPDDIGKKLGDTTKAKITTPHRIMDIPGQGPRNAINIKIGNKDFTLGLNKTNARVIAKTHGKNSDDWVGKIITLYRTEANNPKTMKTVPAIRVG